MNHMNPNLDTGRTRSDRPNYANNGARTLGGEPLLLAAPRPVPWGEDDSECPDPPDNFDAWHDLPEDMRATLSERFERGTELEWDRRQAARQNLENVRQSVIKKQRAAKAKRQMKFSNRPRMAKGAR